MALREVLPSSVTSGFTPTAATETDKCGWRGRRGTSVSEFRVSGLCVPLFLRSQRTLVSRICGLPAFLP